MFFHAFLTCFGSKPRARPFFLLFRARGARDARRLRLRSFARRAAELEGTEEVLASHRALAEMSLMQVWISVFAERTENAERMRSKRESPLASERFRKLGSCRACLGGGRSKDDFGYFMIIIILIIA